MKDYLIKFNADGRRGTTYADGVHYNVNPDGSVTDGTVKVKDLLEAGYIFVDADDYSNLLGNNPERQEYCRKEDGSFVTYVPPEPTDEEKAAVEKAALKAEYESGKKNCSAPSNQLRSQEIRMRSPASKQNLRIFLRHIKPRSRR